MSYKNYAALKAVLKSIYVFAWLKRLEVNSTRT